MLDLPWTSHHTHLIVTCKRGLVILGQKKRPCNKSNHAVHYYKFQPNQKQHEKIDIREKNFVFWAEAKRYSNFV